MQTQFHDVRKGGAWFLKTSSANYQYQIPFLWLRCTISLQSLRKFHLLKKTLTFCFGNFCVSWKCQRCEYLRSPLNWRGHLAFFQYILCLAFFSAGCTFLQVSLSGKTVTQESKFWINRSSGLAFMSGYQSYCKMIHKMVFKSSEPP